MSVPTENRDRPATAKRRLRDALHDLILEHGYDGFTVGDLLDRAAVSRSSFYAHFRDKDDLLLHGFEELGPPPVRVDEAGLPDFAQWLFSATEARKPLASTLLARSSRGVVCQHLENTLVVLMREALRDGASAAGPGLAVELKVRYHVGALMGLWQWWVDHDYPVPAAEMAGTFHRLSQSGLGPVPGVRP